MVVRDRVMVMIESVDRHDEYKVLKAKGHSSALNVPGFQWGG